MKLYELIQHINASIPNVDVLADQMNRPLDVAQRFRSNFVFLPKKELHNPSLLNLSNVEEYYHIKNICLSGPMCLMEEPWTYRGLGTFVASIDTEFIILQPYGNLVIVDGYNWYNKFYDVARTEEQFYDAIYQCIPISSNFTKTPFNDKWRDNIIKNAAIAAGGMEYYGFYDAYLG